MPTLIPDKITKLTLDEGIRCFADGWVLALGWKPKARQLAVLFAHVLLEVGHDLGALHNNGFGNVKASASWPGKYSMYGCDERTDPATARKWLLDPRAYKKSENGDGTWTVGFWPPHPQTWFRAFDSPAEGAAEHIRFLAVDSDGDGKNHYQAAWNMVLAGDAEGFVHCLKMLGYFTGPEAAYAKAVVSIANRIGPACDRILTEEPHEITDDDREHVAQMFAMWAYEQRGSFAEPFPLEPTEKNS